MIIEKVNVITSQDHGKKLFSLLSEYGNLSDTNKALQLQIESLTKQAAGLEQQAKLKGKIQGEIADLKAEKASLEPQVADLYNQRDELIQIQDQHNYIQTEVDSLIKKKGALEQEISKLKTREESLRKEIKVKEQKVSDLEEVESKRVSILKEIAGLQAKFEHEQKRWDIYESFLGLVLKGSIAEMEKFSEVLPSLLEDVKKGEYKPEQIKSFILQQLAGPELLVFKCTRCQETFRISNPMPSGGYYCPKCGFTHNVVVYKDAAVILKGLLAEAHQPITVKKTIIKQIEPKDEGN